MKKNKGTFVSSSGRARGKGRPVTSKDKPARVRRRADEGIKLEPALADRRAESAYRKGWRGTKRAKKLLAANATCKDTPEATATGVAGDPIVPRARSKSKGALMSKPPKPPLTPQPMKTATGTEQFITLDNRLKIAICGMTDEFGTRYVSCRAGKIRTLTPYAAWHGGGGKASAALRDQELILVRGFGEVCDEVAKIKRFPEAPIVARPGWSRYGFAQADGRVSVPVGHDEPRVAFPTASGHLDRSGTLDGWIERVAVPVAEHSLASFFMMVMFAAPLLQFTNRADNIGFELSGEGGRGKTTLQLLMASAAGPAIGNAGTTYWRSLNTTMNALEEVMSVYADMPLILDEAGLVQGAGRADSRGESMRELAFRLTAGRVKHRFGEPTGPRSRLVYMISTNRPVASLLNSSHTAESEAIADRLITLPLLSDRIFGIFDHCPPDYASTGAFADALKQGARENFGHALPTYLQYLVNKEAQDPDGLRCSVDRCINSFVKQSGIDPNDGSRTRVAKAMGLVYAGGRAAQASGVLPSSYRCMEAAQAALALHLSHGRTVLSFDDRLIALMRRPDIIDLSNVSIDTIPEARLKQCPVFLYLGRSRQRELIVPIEHVDRVLPDWNGDRREPDVRVRLKTSSDRTTRDRPIGAGGTQRPVYCFDITDLEA